MLVINRRRRSHNIVAISDISPSLKLLGITSCKSRNINLRLDRAPSKMLFKDIVAISMLFTLVV